jgi:CDGSH-type Zn-finger protein
MHFAECVRGLPRVFDVKKRPWIQPENASAEQVAEVVRRCPSGALHYRLEEGPTEEPELPTHVEFVANGPIILRGDLSIDLPAGRMREVRASLCRCGRTENESFCDKTRGRSGWRSEAPTRTND